MRDLLFQIDAWIRQRLSLLLIVLALPLLVPCFEDQIDWDVDWAQYIHQAQNRLEGSIDEQVILNHEDYGPRFKGGGFSLALLPLYTIWGLYAPPYYIFQWIALVLAVVLFLLSIKRQFKQSGFLLLFIGLLVLYNFQMVRLARQLTPEFLYMALLYGAFYVYKVRKSLLWASVLVGFAISVRDIGWALFIALLVLELRDAFRQKRVQPKRMATSVGVPILVLTAVEFFMFHDHFLNRLEWYAPHFTGQSPIEILSENAAIYAQQFRYLFEQEVYGWLNATLLLLTTILLFVGIAMSSRRPWELIDMYAVLHIVILLLYTYNKASMRFLLPILPILLHYMLQPLAWLYQRKTLGTSAISVGMVLVLLASNYINTRDAMSWYTTNGPRSAHAMETWDAIQSHVPPDGVIASRHPLVVHLYAGRRGYVMHHADSLHGEVSSQVTHVLVNTWTEAEDLTQVWMHTYFQSKSVWRNKQFELYQVIQ